MWFSKSFRGFQWLLWSIGPFREVFEAFHSISERFSRFQRVSVDFRASQRVSGSFSRFQRVSADFREFQANLDSFSRFQIVLPTICEFWKFATLWADFLILVRHYGSAPWCDILGRFCDILGQVRHSGPFATFWGCTGSIEGEPSQWTRKCFSIISA